MMHETPPPAAYPWLLHVRLYATLPACPQVQATQGNSSGFGDTASGSPSATALAGSVDVDMLVMRSAGEDGGVDGAAPGSGSNDCVLPLLMPCPNRVAGSGVNRELFVLTPCVLELTPLPAAGGGPSGSLYDAYYGPAPWPSGHRPAFYVPAGAARTPMVLTPLLVEFYRCKRPPLPLTPSLHHVLMPSFPPHSLCPSHLSCGCCGCLCLTD
jgi:hypothetical protein